MVRDLLEEIRKSYVSESLAEQMSDTITWKMKNGRYHPELNVHEFAFELTKDLRRITKDLHFSVTAPMYDYDKFISDTLNFSSMSEKQRKKTGEKIRKQLTEIRTAVGIDMFSYGDIKILPGNIGYIEIKDFNSKGRLTNKANKGRISIESAMRYLESCDALIIDLRENHGGYVELAAKFCSFFSPKTGSYFISSRTEVRLDSSGTEKKYVDTSVRKTSREIPNSFAGLKSVFILTSERTFSAAELVTYKLKRYNPKVTIVGEKTKGGGNGSGGPVTTKYITALVPSSRLFDQENSNYSIEGTGITPDILTGADSALIVALRHLAKKVKSTNEKEKHFKKEKKVSVTYNVEIKKDFPYYAGDYSKINIFIENDQLFLTYDTGQKLLLLPIRKDEFFTSDKRPVTFSRDRDNHILAIQIAHSDEFVEVFRKRTNTR